MPANAARHIAAVEDDAMPNGTAQEWEKDWREGVNQQLGSLTTMLQQFITEVRTRLSVVETGQNDLRAKPADMRNWSMLWLMVGGLAVSALCGGAGLVMSLVNLLAAHWH